MEKDEKLIELYLDGDYEAFTKIYRKYEMIVFRMILSHINDFHHAQDVLQEVFVKAARGLKKLSKKEAFRSWLLAIAKNEVSQFYRKRGMQVKVSVNSEQLDNVKAFDFDLGFYIEYLKIKNVDILILYHHGYTLKELGKIFDCSHETIRNRLHEAKRKINKLLQEKK